MLLRTIGVDVTGKSRLYTAIKNYESVSQCVVLRFVPLRAENELNSSHAHKTGSWHLLGSFQNFRRAAPSFLYGSPPGCLLLCQNVTLKRGIITQIFKISQGGRGGRAVLKSKRGLYSWSSSCDVIIFLIINPYEVLVSSDVIPSNNFCNIFKQGSSLCNSARLSFLIYALRDINMAAL